MECAYSIQLSSAGLLTNDFVTSEIDDHAHRMLKHLITKHLQVWTNTNENLSHRPKQSKFHYLSQPNFSDKMT